MEKEKYTAPEMEVITFGADMETVPASWGHEEG